MFFGPTNPNGLYMWTGWIDPNGTAGGPIIDNTPAFNNVILSWTSYPERLEQAGITGHAYQGEDNYDNNALAWFTQYANAPTSCSHRPDGVGASGLGSCSRGARGQRWRGPGSHELRIWLQKGWS